MKKRPGKIFVNYCKKTLDMRRGRSYNGLRNIEQNPKEERKTMTIEEVKEKMKSNYESPAWKLVERIVNEMNKRGIEPDGIVLWDGGQKPLGTRLIGVEPVYRSNGTSEDVSAKIVICEEVKLGWIRIAKIKVPGGASDKVINNRIDKALAYK